MSNTPLRILTTGCFDLLHIGHIRLLQYCATLGAVTVGINCDTTISRLKPNRPILPEAERVEMLESLRCVHEVVIFHEQTPAELIKRFKPDIFVKGRGYTTQTLPELPALQAVGGKLVLWSDPDFDRYSTTALIERITSFSKKRN